MMDKEKMPDMKKKMVECGAEMKKMKMPSGTEKMPNEEMNSNHERSKNKNKY